MKRTPVTKASAPAYPHRRGRWAFGLLALGAASLASPALTGCATLSGGAHGNHACPGDMVEPEQPPAPPPAEAAAGGDGEKSEPCVIPEATEGPVGSPELHIRGDMPAVHPEPVRPPGEMPIPEDVILGDMPMAHPETVPEVEHPGPVPGDVMAVDPEIIAVDGDIDVPHIDGDVMVPDPEILPEPPDHRIAGGMPAPGFEPGQQPPDEGGEAEPCPVVEELPLPGVPPHPAEPIPGGMKPPAELIPEAEPEPGEES